MRTADVRAGLQRLVQAKERSEAEVGGAGSSWRGCVQASAPPLPRLAAHAAVTQEPAALVA